MSVELTDAIEAVKSHKRGYEQIRQGIDLLAMTRARADFGMAYLNLIDMFVAKAEAEDQRDPAWAARGAGRKKLAGWGGWVGLLFCGRWFRRLTGWLGADWQFGRGLAGRGGLAVRAGGGGVAA